MQKEKNLILKTESSFYNASSINNNGVTTRGTTVPRGASVEDTLEVNDMLIDAIKAKLAILDNMD